MEESPGVSAGEPVTNANGTGSPKSARLSGFRKMIVTRDCFRITTTFRDFVARSEATLKGPADHPVFRDAPREMILPESP